MEATLNRRAPSKGGRFFSKPLFMQSLKANWPVWLAMTIGSAMIFLIINVVICSRDIFNSIDMGRVATYVESQQLDWLAILGLLESLGFKLSRIELMSQIDINSVISDLVYRIAGVLLPMVFVMITCHSLLASQVNSGSLAYVLSTPTSRRTVLRTSYLYALAALTAMYVVILASALGSESIAGAIRIANGGKSNMLPLRTTLYCLASFLALFALTGVCFGASAFFNKATYSLAVGGGVCIVSFLGCILGLFGNRVFVAAGIGVEAMNVFNYISIFTLIDTDSIGSFAKNLAGQDAAISYNWIYEMAIMVGIGVVTAGIGCVRFVRKDLPL